MRILRTGLTAAVVAAAVVLPAQSALASPTTDTVTVSPDNLNGWVVGPDSDSPTPPNAFVAGEHTRGSGSLQFGPISDTAASKMIVEHKQVIPAETFGGVSFDYFIPADSGNPSPAQFYLNVYAKVAGSSTTFYDCNYSYNATAAGVGWHTLGVMGATPAADVRVKAPGTATLCGTSPASLVGGSVLSVRLNAGDSTAVDVGLKGGFDDVVVTAGGNATTYDFEPAAVVPATPCTALPAPGRAGTAGNNLVLGTAAADRIDLLGGNDVADGRGGDDCILGGDGNDVLRGAAGNDEISGGAGTDVIDGGDGNDVIDPGAGRDVVSAGAGDDTLNTADGAVDVVDCGAGTDTVTADRGDVLRNCEDVTRA